MRKIDDYEYLHLWSESRGESESTDLAPARGILNGMAFSLACWGLLGLVVIIWRAVR